MLTLLFGVEIHSRFLAAVNRPGLMVVNTSIAGKILLPG